MKFKGYGKVWDNEKNRILVDFESTATEAGIIEVSDKRKIDILIGLGYKPENDEKEIVNETKVTEEQKEPINPVDPEKESAKEEWLKTHKNLQGFEMIWRKAHPEIESVDDTEI